VRRARAKRRGIKIRFAGGTGRLGSTETVLDRTRLNRERRGNGPRHAVVAEVPYSRITETNHHPYQTLSEKEKAEIRRPAVSFNWGGEGDPDTNVCDRPSHVDLIREHRSHYDYI